MPFLEDKRRNPFPVGLGTLFSYRRLDPLCEAALPSGYSGGYFAWGLGLLLGFFKEDELPGLTQARGMMPQKSEMPSPDLWKEIKRKSFHLISSLYVLGYLTMERGLFLKSLSILFLLVAGMEFGRLFFLNWNMKVMGVFYGIHRTKELHQPSGIFWTLLGSLLTMGFVPNKNVVLCSMGYLIFGDAIAALVGVSYGRHQYRGKSLEGSLSFFLVALLIGLFFFSPLMAFSGAVFATLVESLPLPFNDNLWIPLLSAAFLTSLLGLRTV